jgi:hypothetical protein
VAEWTNAAVLKTVDRGDPVRGFESLPLRCYAARARLDPLCIEGFGAGGQLLTTGMVENFPSHADGILGPDLGNNLRASLEGEEALQGRGIAHCSICDGALFAGKRVMVVGGDDAAMEEAYRHDGGARRGALADAHGGRHGRRERRGSAAAVDRGRHVAPVDLRRMPTRNVPVQSAGAHVQDVMLSAPRTLTPEATAGEARAAFENPRERLLLVARGEAFVGTVTRDALPDHVGDDEPLAGLADRDGDRVQPDDSVTRALELLDAAQSERLPVVTGDGTLVGLICFNRRRGHFCVDG